MEREQITRQLLQTYYKGFAEKNESWESAISEDFEYTDGDMNNVTPLLENKPTLISLNGFLSDFKPCPYSKW